MTRRNRLTSLFIYNSYITFTINKRSLKMSSFRISQYLFYCIVINLQYRAVYSVCLTDQTDFTVNYVTNGDFQTPYLGANKHRFTTDQLDGWTSTKIQQGTGSIYNPRWGSATQVIQMDTDKNERYIKNFNLPKSKFLFRISYAAREGRNLSTSGLNIYWNGVQIRSIPTSLDYNIHTQSFILQANQGPNQVILQGAGTSDAVGMSCDNVILNKMNSYNRVDVGGLCLCDVGYYDDFVNWNCQPCSNLDPQCEQCTYQKANSTNNSTNNSSLYVFQCQKCKSGYFSLGGACVLCNTYLPGCTNCSSDGLQCSACDSATNYFQNPSFNASQVAANISANSSNSSNFSTLIYYDFCTLCSLQYCIVCSSLFSCTICNQSANYFLNSSLSLCQPCTLQGCTLCANLTKCISCNNNDSYYFDNLTSIQCSYCNNSYNQFLNMTNLECQNCTLEGCIDCLNLTNCQICEPGLFVFNSTSLLCDPCAIQGCLSCLTSTQCGTCNQNQGYSLDNSGKCLQCYSCSCWPGGRIDNPAVPDVIYSQEQCGMKEIMETLSTGIAVTSYIIMFFSVISIKIVGLELFGVLQLAYFNLADNQHVNLYLSPLLQWKFLNGFNLNLTSNSPVPLNVKAIDYQSSFISNINIMFLILLLQLVISLVLVLLSRKFASLQKIGKFLLQDVFLTLFLFNSFNIAFSIGIHFKYADFTEQYYVVSTILAVVGIGTFMISLYLLQNARNKEFGEYKGKFKDNFIDKLYIPISIVYRMALGLFMAITNEEMFGTLLILAFSLAYIMYNIVNLPFIDAYQNYRANLCHVTQLIILLVTNYYRSMKHNVDLQIKSKIFTPAKLQVAMLVVCIIFSAACLLYQIYLIIKKRKKMRSTINNENFTYQKNDQSHSALNEQSELNNNVFTYQSQQ